MLKDAPNVGVDLAFVDGEDYGKSFDAPYKDVPLGSQHFAEHLPSSYRPIFGILGTDGDKDLNILQKELDAPGPKW